MTESKSKRKSLAVPSGRSARFLKVARMAAGVAGGFVAEGSRQLAKGKRPQWQEMLLTPQNAKRVTQRLSEMRGAAMKLGQMLSMESDSLLPPALAEILGNLRENATTMPETQLQQSLVAALGEDWEQRFDLFEREPLAAASIGQVHQAELSGQALAVKVQYPGVSKSIDSDVDNIASLLNMTRLIPEHVELDGILEDTKQQLHEEADYLREARFLAEFRQKLEGDPRYLVPEYYAELSGKTVLTMSLVDGYPIEKLSEVSSDTRDQAMHSLFELMFNELFDWRMMQTDPNFANYRWQLDQNDDALQARIVLLDFGATRTFKKGFVANYRKLVKAIIEGSDEELLNAAKAIGYAVDGTSDAYQRLLLDIFYLALEPIRFDEDYSFKEAQLPRRVAELAQKHGGSKDFWQTPPTDALYLHRKIGGMFMLAERLNSTVNLHSLIKPKIRHVRLAA